MKRSGIPLDLLTERLGSTYTRRVYGSGTTGHVYWLMWTCNGPENPYDSCRAITRGDVAFPTEGWELTTCSRHAGTFSDFPSADEA